MDRFAEKQAQIDRQRAELIARYPALWEKLIAELTQPGPDRAWLTYSANYLFRTAGIRWALDPLTLSWRLKDSAPVDVSALGALSFILLTHRHADHQDLELLSALRHFPISWVVPEFILSQVLEAGIPFEKIIVPQPLQPIDLNGLHITPFDGLHWETEVDGNLRGVPALGYLVEWGNKRWLFPGDTRTYDASQLPNFGPINGLFAHLWLGRGCAQREKPPLLESFCRFCLELRPRQIILTHLDEFGRDAFDFWGAGHAKRVRSLCQQSGMSVYPRYHGDSVIL
jgi:L-ascorbate metabolism protein UlaG (beta-lactamase superfamily)